MLGKNVEKNKVMRGILQKPSQNVTKQKRRVDLFSFFSETLEQSSRIIETVKYYFVSSVIFYNHNKNNFETNFARDFTTNFLQQPKALSKIDFPRKYQVSKFHIRRMTIKKNNYQRMDETI